MSRAPLIRYIKENKAENGRQVLCWRNVLSKIESMKSWFLKLLQISYFLLVPQTTGNTQIQKQAAPLSLSCPNFPKHGMSVFLQSKHTWYFRHLSAFFQLLIPVHFVTHVSATLFNRTHNTEVKHIVTYIHTNLRNTEAKLYVVNATCKRFQEQGSVFR